MLEVRRRDLLYVRSPQKGAGHAMTPAHTMALIMFSKLGVKCHYFRNLGETSAPQTELY